MKKLLAIILALVFAISAITLTSCVSDGTESDTKSESSEEQSEVNNEVTDKKDADISEKELKEVKLEGGTEVKNLDGKTPYQLYTGIKTTMDTITQYKMNGTMTSGEEKEVFGFTLGENTAYMYSDDSEGWFVDGTVYTKSGESKTKRSATFENIKSSCEDYWSYIYLGEVLTENYFDGVKLMKTDGGLYYFTLSFTAENSPIEGAAFTYTLAFDNDGVVVQSNLDMTNNDMNICMLLAVGKVAPISAPADASSYVERSSVNNRVDGEVGIESPNNTVTPEIDKTQIPNEAP